MHSSHNRPRVRYAYTCAPNFIVAHSISVIGIGPAWQARMALANPIYRFAFGGSEIPGEIAGLPLVTSEIWFGRQWIDIHAPILVCRRGS